MAHNIDKLTCELIMLELKTAAAEVFARHGLSEPKISGKYGDTLEVKLAGVLLVAGPNGVNLGSAEAIAFERFKVSYGLGHVSLGDTFISGGRQFALTGLATRNRRYPFTAKCLADGKSYKFTDDLKHRSFSGPDGRARLPLALPATRV